MKVLNVCFDDYANFSYSNAKALQSVGIDAKCVKMKAHPFGYAEQGEVLSSYDMDSAIGEADFIQIMHSDEHCLEIVKKYNKPAVVYHTGTKYRNDPAGMNERFNPHVLMCFTDQCEFMQLGAKGIRYIATAIDTDTIKPVEYVQGEYTIFAHYPSKAEVKGTQHINEMMHKIVKQGSMLEYRVDTEMLVHEAQLNRMNECDVYIELFKLRLFDKPYGCFGVTAFEASALGKIVITNNIYEHVYTREYGDCALQIANTPERFESLVRKFDSMSREDLTIYQNACRRWIEEKHSYKATGEKLAGILQRYVKED